jgi:hypothetical protein
MEPEGSIPTSQELSTCPYPEPGQSSPHHPTSTRSILILSNHLRLGLPSGLLPSGFTTNNLYAFLFPPIRATCQIPSHPPRLHYEIQPEVTLINLLFSSLRGFHCVSRICPDPAQVWRSPRHRSRPFKQSVTVCFSSAYVYLWAFLKPFWHNFFLYRSCTVNIS